MTENHNDGVQLCWSCKKACGGCSWSEADPKTDEIKFEPIPGWTATKTIKNANGVLMESYDIRDCPLYDEDRAASKTNTPKYDVEQILFFILSGMTDAEICRRVEGLPVNTLRKYKIKLRKAGRL